MLQLQVLKLYYKYVNMKLPAYLQNLLFSLNRNVHNINIRIEENIHTNRAKHDFAKRYIRYDIPLLINNTSKHIRKTKLTHSLHGFIRYAKTKMIPELRDLSYEEHLKECGLTTLETRRLRGGQIEVFKILNGYENIDRNMFFSLKKDSRTRGHEVKLVKDQCRLDIRKHSFSQRTINEWNKLSTDCVTARKVNMFKNKVDTYLRRAGYK